MLSANEARDLRLKTTEIQHLNRVATEYDPTLKLIENDIKFAISQGKTFVEYKWDFYRNKINDVFPNITDDFYHWDGEGTSSYLAESGKYITSKLKAAGYDMWVAEGVLHIDW